MLSFNEKTCLRDPCIRPQPHPWHCCTSFWGEWSMVPHPTTSSLTLLYLVLRWMINGTAPQICQGWSPKNAVGYKLMTRKWTPRNLWLENGHSLFVRSSLRRTYCKFNSPLGVGYWTINRSFMNCCSYIMTNELPLSTKIQETSWPTIAAMITRG